MVPIYGHRVRILGLDMNSFQKFLVLVIGGGAVYYLYQNNLDPSAAIDDATSDLQAAVMGWKNAGSGPTWVPVLNAAESQYGLPQDLLAALAFQESSFIEALIRGTRASSAGALGMMQLMPQWYASLVGPVGAAVPYQDSDVENQITAAAQTLITNYNQLGSWPLAIAAYNAGVTAVQKAGGIPQNGQTPAYVAGILGNAPAADSA
jgi:soluble lytic murein transglycosylase-like protein